MGMDQNNDLVVSGLRFPPHFRRDLVERSLGYVQASEDIVLVSYPKCGVHWLTHLLGLVLNDFAPVKPAVYLEAAGNNGTLKPEGPRIVFTHMTADLLGDKPNKLNKVIYLCRIPPDVVVSYHYHCSALSMLYNETSKDLQEFVTDFLNGDCCYGCYFAHVKGWLQTANCKVLLVTYEQLHLEFHETMETILGFIGKHDWLQREKQYKLCRLKTETRLHKTKKLITSQLKGLLRGSGQPQVEHLNDQQRSNVEDLRRDENLESYVSAFARTGLIGEGQKSLKSADLDRIQSTTEARLGDTALIDVWRRLGFCRAV